LAPKYLSELDGAIFKIDSILNDEFEKQKLDNFSKVKEIN